MKRLLICSPSHAVVGGVESIVNDLSRELPRRGWDAILGLGRGTRFHDVDRYRNTYPDLPIVEIDGTKGTRQGRVEALVKLINHIRPDLVLSARVFDAYEAAVQIKKQDRKLRFAITVQVYEPHYLYDAREFRSSIDLCVTSGNLIREALITWAGLQRQRVISIPGGVSPPTQPAKSRNPRLPIRIGYVGRLDQDQKRIYDLIPLLRELDSNGPAYTLDVIGSGPCEIGLVQELQTWISSGRVRFHGWQSKDRLYGDFFPNMDCLVHFAHTEGITIAPREAMANGVVPVISQFSGLYAEQHFVHDQNCLTFPVSNVDQAAASIRRLVSEPGLLNRLSRNACASQQGKYTFAGSIDAWADSFDQCMMMDQAVGDLPNLNYPADGRLTSLGMSPWLAQRVRDLSGRRFVHNDPGGEWPTGSGLLKPETAAELERFASDYESRCAAQTNQPVAVAG